MTFKLYRKVGETEMEPWTPATDMTRVSVSPADREAGCPKNGDMIARNPANPDDQWLVNERYFKANYVPV